MFSFNTDAMPACLHFQCIGNVIVNITYNQTGHFKSLYKGILHDDNVAIIFLIRPGTFQTQLSAMPV